MWRRIKEIVKKEFRQALREPRMRVLLFIPPLVQLIIFGYAVNLDVEHCKIAWMDNDHSPQSRELLAKFTGSANFKVVVFPQNEYEMQELLDRGKVLAVVRVLSGFARDIQKGNSTTVQILVDGSNSNTASIVSSYASKVISTYTQNVLISQFKNRQYALTTNSKAIVKFPTSNLIVKSRVWFNLDLQSRNYFVPGVVVNIIALVTIMLTAMSIVREKEIGTMEQLMVTPIRPWELILGKILPFALVGIFEVGFITTAALLVFHIPFRGSIVMLLFCAILFLFTTLGVGLFISTISQTQQQAMMSSFLFFMPAFMLSGFAFPIRNMPELVQILTYINPIRYFMEIVRGIFLKGSGLIILWPQVLALLLLGLSILSLSVIRFHKRLD